MDCSTCERLRLERESHILAGELATQNLRAAAPYASIDQYERLWKIADETKTDLDRIEAAILQHQSSHSAGPAMESA